MKDWKGTLLQQCKEKDCSKRWTRRWVGEEETLASVQVFRIDSRTLGPKNAGEQQKRAKDAPARWGKAKEAKKGQLPYIVTEQLGKEDGYPGRMWYNGRAAGFTSAVQVWLSTKSGWTQFPPSTMGIDTHCFSLLIKEDSWWDVRHWAMQWMSRSPSSRNSYTWPPVPQKANLLGTGVITEVTT